MNEKTPPSLPERLARFVRDTKDALAMRGYEAHRVVDETKRGGRLLKAYVQSGFREDVDLKEIQSRLAPVKKALEQVPPDRVRGLLRARAIGASEGYVQGDSAVVIPLSEFFSYAPHLEVGDITYQTYAARVVPNSPNRLRPQSHRPRPQPRNNPNAEEVYRVIGGYGILITGDQTDGRVNWQRRPISNGQTVIIPKGQWHMVVNEGRNPIDYLLATPDTSLVHTQSANR